MGVHLYGYELSFWFLSIKQAGQRLICLAATKVFIRFKSLYFLIESGHQMLIGTDTPITRVIWADNNKSTGML